MNKTARTSTTALSTNLVIENGNFEIAKELFKKNPGKELYVNTPDGKYSIIPVDTDKALLMPSENTSVFDTCTLIRETPDEFQFRTHDMYEEEIDNSFSARLKRLLSDDDSSSATEYVIEKDYITKLVEQTSVSFEELMTALARIIETYPTVTVKNKTRPTTPYEVVDIFTVLLQHEISFEHIYLKLISLGDDFFNQLISAKNKFSLFKKYEYDDV